MRLSIAERIQLVGDIWDSIAEESENLSLTQSERDELDRRLADYRRNPHQGSSWDRVRERIKNRL